MCWKSFNKFILLFAINIISVCIAYANSNDTFYIHSDNGTLNLSNEDSVSATVYVSYIKETSGKISNIKVERIKCKNCSKKIKENLKSEAIRVVSSIDDSEPRKYKIKFIQPITFKLALE